MKKILYSLILLTLLFGAFNTLAQDTNLPSPGILPDSPFYFLKAWKEAIQNFFTFGAENKAKQFLHLADVRLAEYQKMIEKGKTEIAQKTLDKYQKQLDHALQKIEELKNKGEDTKGISQKVEDTINKHIEILQGNLQNAPEAAKKGLQNAIENSSKVIEKAGGKTKKENSCLNSGGTVTTASCCQTTNDFPNSCLIGACGCSSDNSHEVKNCDCGTDKCFNGEKCVAVSVAPIAQVTYICNGGKTIEAVFYKGESKPVEPGQPPIPSGSVKIVLSDGRNFDLPQTISADGGRYANSDESFIFWSKGDGALMLENNVEKNYTGCFTQVKEGIRVNSPNGGETWSKGQKVQISWSAAKEIKSVNIRLVISGNEDSQNFNAAIASDISNIGNYEWTVQDLYAEVLGIKALPASDKYLVTIEDKDHNNIYDTSDATFSIK